MHVFLINCTLSRLVFTELLMPVVILIVLQNVVGLEPRNMGVSLVTGNPNITNNAQLEKYCEERDVHRRNVSNQCLENLGICDFLRNFKPHEFDWVMRTIFNRFFVMT